MHGFPGALISFLHLIDSESIFITSVERTFTNIPVCAFKVNVSGASAVTPCVCVCVLRSHQPYIIHSLCVLCNKCLFFSIFLWLKPSKAREVSVTKAALSRVSPVTLFANVSVWNWSGWPTHIFFQRDFQSVVESFEERFGL